MKTYIVNINSENEDKLKKYGKITFKSYLEKGLYLIESNHKIDDLKSLDFIENIEPNHKGFLL